MGSIRHLMREGNYAEAIALLKKNLEINPRGAETWQSIGKAYIGLGNFAQAEAAYTKAIEVTPEGRASIPFYLRGYLRWYLGKYGPALADLRAADTAGLDEYTTPELSWYKAQTYAALGSLGKAIFFYERYQEHAGPSCFDPDREIQRLEMWEQKKLVYRLSWAGFIPIVEVGEAGVKVDLPEKVVQDSIPFYWRGQYQEAVALFKEAAAQMPENDRLWRYLGHAHWYTGEETAANQAFQTAYQLDPRQAAACFCWGCMQYIKREYPLALEMFNQVESLGLAPYDYDRFYQYRADIYEKLGYTDAALRDYQAYSTYTGQHVYQDHIMWLRKKKRTGA